MLTWNSPLPLPEEAAAAPPPPLADVEEVGDGGVLATSPLLAAAAAAPPTPEGDEPPKKLKLRPPFEGRLPVTLKEAEDLLAKRDSRMLCADFE